MINTMKTVRKNSPAPKAASKTIAAPGAKSPKKNTTSAKSLHRRPAAAAPRPQMELTEVEIATCAYFIYVSEGCPAGREMDHWLEAEARLRGR
jgi:hypothetical protein